MSNLTYKQKLYAIRPYVKIDVDARKQLTRRDKWLISYYFNQINELSLRLTQPYKPKTRANAKVAKRHVGLKGQRWKAYPIRTPIPDSQIKVVKGKIRVVSGMLGETTYYDLDQELLATDGADEACVGAGVPKKVKPPKLTKDGQSLPIEEYQVTMAGHLANGRTTSYKVLVRILNEYTMQYKSAEDGNDGLLIGVAILKYAKASKEAKKRFNDRANAHQRKRPKSRKSKGRKDGRR